MRRLFRCEDGVGSAGAPPTRSLSLSFGLVYPHHGGIVTGALTVFTLFQKF